MLAKKSAPKKATIEPKPPTIVAYISAALSILLAFLYSFFKILTETILLTAKGNEYEDNKRIIAYTLYAIE